VKKKRKKKKEEESDPSMILHILFSPSERKRKKGRLRGERSPEKAGYKIFFVQGIRKGSEGGGRK